MTPEGGEGEAKRPRRGRGVRARRGAKGDAAEPRADGEDAAKGESAKRAADGEDAAKGESAKRAAKKEGSVKGDTARRTGKGDSKTPPAKTEKPRRRARRGAVRKKRSNPLSRLRTAEAIYLLAAVLLFVLMFLDWYGVKGATSAEPLGGVVTSQAGGSAWDMLEVIPLFLMLAIVVAVGGAVLRLSGSDWKPAIPPAAAVCVLGLLAALLVFIRIIDPPGPGEVLEGAFDTTLKPAIFLALAAALGIAYGGRRAMADEGTSFAGLAKKLEAPARPRSAAKKKPAAGHKS
jgi:hypothetical protein